MNYVIELRRTRAEVYIDRGYSDRDNEAIFDQILAHREVIESACGHGLSWERLEGKRACRIAWRLENGGYRSPEEEWPRIQDALVGAMIRFEAALSPYLRKLVVPPIPFPSSVDIAESAVPHGDPEGGGTFE